MNRNEQVFLERYQNLNPEQQLAVTTTEGPVMVIAGPGTGKTEILSMRIANLLRSEAQVKPHEILCLTYTDEGSVAMRKRLLQIIGEDAHRVNIFTFHAFCNTVIQNNAAYFGMRELQPLSDLERTEIIHSILENLPPDNMLRKLKGAIYSDAYNLISLFDLMKREYWTVATMTTAIDQYIDSLPDRKEFQYQRAGKGFQKGDLKTHDIAKEQKKMWRSRAAAELFTEYERLMAEKGRYDFTDMLLWVIDAFRNNEDFLRNYQERFQYVLVDEFQDTSGAQNQLLALLMDYWDIPNIFTVGDDDQSIFEFQGARLKNIEDFYHKYYRAQEQGSIKVIVLVNNYRSSQEILTRASQVINHNEERLIRKLHALHLDKDIKAAHPRFLTEERSVLPVVKAYVNPLHEDADILQQIELLRSQGVNLSNVAILYSKHAQAGNLINLMERKNIPYWVKRPVDILSLPLVQHILDIFRYIHAEHKKPFSGEAMLFALMHVPFFGISPRDIAALSLQMQQKDASYKHYRLALLDGLALAGAGLESVKAMHSLGKAIEKWIGDAKSLTISMLLEKIIYDAGIVTYFLNGPNQVWDMQVVHTLFNFVKEECSRQPRLSLSGFLKILDDMDLAGITLPIQKVVKQEDGVRFYTAFGAKGHEFEYVFLLGCNKKHWEAKTGNNSRFAIPDTISSTQDNEETSSKEESMRRVFFVAITRAKKHLQVSYTLEDEKGKTIEASKFVAEMDAAAYATAEQNIAAVDTPELMQHLSWAMRPSPPVDIALAKKELLTRRLESFALSASTLNSYLKCPVAFYYEQILRVPVAKNDSLSFGIAVHYALERLFKKMQEDPDKRFPNVVELVEDFNKMMWREQDAFTELQYNRRKELGEKILTDYYNHYIDSFNKVVSIERNFNNIQVVGVPIKGKLDKIEFDGTTCKVIDYKTGNPDYSISHELLPPNEKNTDGGNYWRQMVFYKILLEASPAAYEGGWKMGSGIFDFIEQSEKKDQFVRYEVPIGPDDVQVVATQIKNSYRRIMNHEFNQGCEQEDCRWCTFVKTHELHAPEIPEQEVV